MHILTPIDENREGKEVLETDFPISIENAMQLYRLFFELSYWDYDMLLSHYSIISENPTYVFSRLYRKNVN